MKVARRSDVAPFIVMDVMRAADERAAAGGDVLHLEVGQPSTPAPKGVLAAAHAALDDDLLGYTQAFGLLELRQRIAQHYQDWYGVTVDAERVAITFGASGAFILAFLAAFDAGDRVALAAPGYPAYRNILQALDIEVVELPATEATGFQPTPELLATAGRLDGVIVASPANPTGTMLSLAEYQALADWCATNDVRLVSDEIYHGITYGGVATTALAVSTTAIIANSFSKYFSMTGWRLGWLVLPEDLVRPVERLAQNLFISAPTIAQRAAIAAFDCHEECRANLSRYEANRALLLERLPAAGFTRFAPADGAFYLYADVSHMTDDSMAFCRQILADTGVAITPGLDFDRARGHHWVRFSFAGSTEDMAEAAQRLIAWRARNR
ncbi:MAG: aminotransferase class I/II-fold pyridoxal phosphate-dependent enzyme [Alphaproteobacteria bacterium]|nr:MAG: aminotransferase class I/II-fold pyridoxal phosphate-dependent enzyme [Alphaproteobacteria bacterium]